MSESLTPEAAILRLTTECGPTASISPIDAARLLEPGPGDAWRHKLSAVRRAALRLAEEGRIDILRKGKPVPPAEARGVVRLRIRPPAEG